MAIDNTNSVETKRQPYSMPFFETNICNLSKGKYSVIGSVLEVSDDTITINDGTGELKLKILPTTVKPENIKEGSQIRALGYIESKGDYLRAVIIQDLSGVDLNLYQKIREMEQQIFSG